tara:strand:+ start:108 stop:458 length:351 start_codon:yes stop_codon:yes gene_type:complete
MKTKRAATEYYWQRREYDGDLFITDGRKTVVLNKKKGVFLPTDEKIGFDTHTSLSRDSAISVTRMFLKTQYVEIPLPKEVRGITFSKPYDVKEEYYYANAHKHMASKVAQRYLKQL